MYLWQIEYNIFCMLEVARGVVNRFKLCIFDRLNTTPSHSRMEVQRLWIALNYVSLTDWIQQNSTKLEFFAVVNRFKLCIFDRLNTTQKRNSCVVWTVVNRFKLCIFDRLNTTDEFSNSYFYVLWIALNYVSLTDWIQLFRSTSRDRKRLWIALNYVSLTDWIQLSSINSLFLLCCESL